MEELTAYLESKQVKALFKELMEQICLERPENVHSFIVSYIQERYTDALESQLVKYEDEDEMELEAEEDEVGELPEPKEHVQQGGARRRRSAVSAESVNPSELKNKPKRVIPKSDEEKKSIWDRLQHNFLFSSLDQEAANDLINAVEEKRFSEGDILMKQGDDGDFFYVVEEGEAHIFVRSEGEEIKVKECRSGDFFGELALMYNAPRAATVKAVTDMRCWAVDRHTFKLTLMESTINKRNRYEQFLDSVPILESLYKYEKLTIADALTAVHFSAGDVVVKEGDSGNDFFIIEKGAVEYTQTNDQQGQSVVGQGSVGDYFGEIALLTNQPRKATVKCIEDCSFLVLDRKTFVRVMGPLDDILKRNISKYKSWLEKKQEAEAQAHAA